MTPLTLGYRDLNWLIKIGQLGGHAWPIKGAIILSKSPNRSGLIKNWPNTRAGQLTVAQIGGLDCTTTSFCVLDITYLLLSQPPLSSPIDTDEMDREAEGREGRATCDSAAVKVIEPRKKHTHEGRVIRRVLVVKPTTIIPKSYGISHHLLTFISSVIKRTRNPT